MQTATLVHRPSLNTADWRGGDEGNAEASVGNVGPRQPPLMPGPAHVSIAVMVKSCIPGKKKKEFAFLHTHGLAFFEATVLYKKERL